MCEEHRFSSVQYSIANIQYSRVCGKVIAYQVGTTNAFLNGGNAISSDYVDGVSLTHGDPTMRQHIWTFAAALAESSKVEVKHLLVHA